MRRMTTLLASALTTAGLVGLVAHVKTRKPSYRSLAIISCAGAVTAVLFGRRAY